MEPYFLATLPGWNALVTHICYWVVASIQAFQPFPKSQFQSESRAVSFISILQSGYTRVAFSITKKNSYSLSNDIWNLRWITKLCGPRWAWKHSTRMGFWGRGYIRPREHVHLFTTENNTAQKLLVKYWRLESRNIMHCLEDNSMEFYVWQSAFPQWWETGRNLSPHTNWLE